MNKLVIDCSTGQGQSVPLTQAEVNQQQTDLQAASAAAVFPANQLAIQQRLAIGIQQMTTWVANNPNGATLNAAQTLALVKMVNGLAKLALNVLTDTNGT